jgi:hypothetical protein
LYAGLNEEDFKTISPNYDMKEFLNNSETSIEDIKVMNSADFYVPNTKVWYSAVETFKDAYITHVDDVDFDEIEVGTVNHCEQDDCIRCGGTGNEPKTDIVEDTNYDGLDNVFELNS